MSTTDDRNRDDDPDRTARVRESARRMAGVHRAAFEELARGAGDDEAGAAHTAGTRYPECYTRGLMLYATPGRDDAHMCRLSVKTENYHYTVGATWHPKAIVSYVGLGQEENAANARRLAAAWNLIDGLPTAVAESAGAGAVGELVRLVRELLHVYEAQCAMGTEEWLCDKARAVLARFDPPRDAAGGDGGAKGGEATDG